MLRLFDIANGTLKEQTLLDNPLQHQAATATWIDAHDPKDDERAQLQLFLRTALPESDDVEEIESSARYFTDNIGIHVRSLFLAQSEGRHHTATVAFILQNERLITLREGALADFRLLRMRARHGQIKAHSPQELLVVIFEQKVENLADAIEDFHRKLEYVSYLVL